MSISQLIIVTCQLNITISGRERKKKGKKDRKKRKKERERKKGRKEGRKKVCIQ